MPNHARTSSISAVSLASSGDGDTAGFQTPEEGPSPKLAGEEPGDEATSEMITPAGKPASSQVSGLRIDVGSNSWLSSSPSSGIGLGIDLTGSGSRTPTATTPPANPDPGSPSSWPSGSPGDRTPTELPCTPPSYRRSDNRASASSPTRNTFAEGDPLSARSARSQDPLLQSTSSSSTSRLSDDLDRQLDALGMHDAELGLGSQSRKAIGARYSREERSRDMDLESLSEWSEDAEEEHFLGESSEDEDELVADALEDDAWSSPLRSSNQNGPLRIGRARVGKRRKVGVKRAVDEDPTIRRAGSRSLLEVVSPLVLSHPLALLPLLPLLPRAFLPAGVVFFIPALIVVAGLSVCSSVVVIYIARYLKAGNFEEISGKIAGEKGLWVARAMLVIGAMGVVVGWLSSVHPILEPVLKSVFPDGSWLQSRILWTLIGSLPLMPTLVPIRHNYAALNRLPEFGVLLLPLIVFLVIGRTVEVVKIIPALPEPDAPTEDAGSVTRALLSERDEPIASQMRAGTALMLLLLLFTPHPHTLPIQTSIVRESRAQFPFVALGVAAAILVLGLPFALVPYYLLSATHSPAPPFGTHRAGVFEVLARASDSTDGWVNFARVAMVTLLLQSASMWTTRGREICLKALGAEREGRLKASRWVGMTMWGFIAGFATVGGWLASKIELLGIALTLAVGWLMPAIYFVKLFHISSPLAIVFPSSQSAPGSAVSQPLGTHGSHSADVLLARKEQELQKKRLTRRLWQDLIVLVGILPFGGFAVLWSAMMFCGAL